MIIVDTHDARMKDIPVPVWIPLLLVAAFAFVVWRSPLPDGQLAWHMTAAAVVFGLCMAGGVGRGAVKLLSAMALRLGMEDALAWFVMLVGFSGPVFLWLYKKGNTSGADTYPILPFAAPAFALTLVYAPIWQNVVGAPPAANGVERKNDMPRPPVGGRTTSQH